MSNKDFEVQDIYNDGVGDFHLNHFFVLFDGKDLGHVEFSDDMSFPVSQGLADRHNKSITSYRDISTDDVTRHLMGVFEHIFNPNSTANVERGTTIYNGCPMLKFTAKMMGYEAPHDDWVFMKRDVEGSHIFATTMNRTSYSMRDQLIESIPYFVPLLGPFESAADLLDLDIPDITPAGLIVPDDNSRHFLAGRRAWKCGFHEASGLHYLETAAFERYSDTAYLIADSFVRPMLDQTWIEFMINFTQILGVEAKDIGDLHGYSKAAENVGPVYYQNDSFSAKKSRRDIRESYEEREWFQYCVERMPSLKSDRMPGL